MQGQTTIFDMLYPKKKITKPIRLIELDDLEYFVDKKDNSICMRSTYGECDLLDNTLYNLIKDGLVEKVE